MPNIRDHDASVYLKLQGDCLHIGGYEVDPVLIEGVTTISFHLIKYAYRYLFAKLLHSQLLFDI